VTRSRAKPAQPATGRHLARRGRDPLERLVQRLRPFQAHLSLRERPRREVDVRVVESGQHAAAVEVDALRRGERGLVHADSAGDPVARDRERPRRRQRRLERPDDPVFEDHGLERNRSPGTVD
jgi:hypothetical protein